MRDEVRAVSSDLHEQWINTWSVHVTPLMWTVLLPPIGWRTLQDRLVSEAFTTYGNGRGGRETLRTALKRISRGLAELEAHPAFKNQALPGFHYQQFLAWGQSPYPDAQFEPAIMLPMWDTFGSPGPPVTRWVPYYPVSYADFLLVLDPQTHWAFIRRSDTPAASPAP